MKGEDQRRAQLAIHPQTVDDTIMCDDIADNSEVSEERSVDREITGGRERVPKEDEPLDQ